MIDWIKRSWRGGFDRLRHGPRTMKVLGDLTVVRNAGSRLPDKERAEHVLGQIIQEWNALPVHEREAYLAAQGGATAAQKNLRLHSIARERNRLKDEIARLKRNKKRHSHLLAELGRLTRLELELEGGKA